MFNSLYDITSNKYFEKAPIPLIFIFTARQTTFKYILQHGANLPVIS